MSSYSPIYHAIMSFISALLEICMMLVCQFFTFMLGLILTLLLLQHFLYTAKILHIRVSFLLLLTWKSKKRRYNLITLSLILIFVCSQLRWKAPRDARYIFLDVIFFVCRQNSNKYEASKFTPKQKSLNLSKLY